MLYLSRCLGALAVVVSVLVSERAGGESAAETRSPSTGQSRTGDEARAAEWPRPVTAGRVVIEGVGALGGAFGALTLGLGFVAFTRPSCDLEGEQDSCGARALDAVAGGVIVAMGSAIVLMPAGTYIAGNAMGGKGSYGWTLLGSSVGIAAGLLGSVPLFAIDEDSSTLLATVFLTGSILAGNVLGYELSSASAARPASAKAAPRGLTVYPHAGFSSGKLVLGVTGGF